MTYQELVKVSLEMLSETLPGQVQITDLKVVAFSSLLERAGIRQDQLRELTVKYLETGKRFPTPAELLECWKGDQEAEIERCWIQARKLIRERGSQASFLDSDFDGDQTALYALQSVTPRVIGMMGPDEVNLVRAQFSRAYKTGGRVDKIVGEFESMNTGLGLPASVAAMYAGLPAPDQKALPGGEVEPEMSISEFIRQQRAALMGKTGMTQAMLDGWKGVMEDRRADNQQKFWDRQGKPKGNDLSRVFD